MKRTLIIVDPQNCFMDKPGAPLAVTGATKDMERLCSHIVSSSGVYGSIIVTLDTHPKDHIAHTMRWVDAGGNHPDPFTIITSDEYDAGVWRAARARDAAWQGEYLRRLNRPHCIWPTHGQKGSWEWKVTDELAAVLDDIESDTPRKVTYLEKGMHPDVEQFGAFGADVPYPGAPETEIHQSLIDSINQSDEVVFAGEASSHCVMDTVNQFAAHIPPADTQKVVLLQDCMSPVPQPPNGPDFPAIAAAWIQDMKARGATVTDSRTYARTL